MKLYRVVSLSLVVMAVVLGALSASWAQDATGRIYGTVYDQQSAVIPQVEITVTNTATQNVRTATTDNEGSFQLLALRISNYNASAKRAGFRLVTSTEQKLLINHALRIDFGLDVGTEEISIDVGNSAAPVDAN